MSAALSAAFGKTDGTIARTVPAVRPLPHRRLRTLRVRPPHGEAAARLAALFDLAMPQAPGAVRSDSADITWMSPGAWLIADADHIEGAEIGAALHGLVFHVGESGDALSGFEVSGPDAALLLARLCPLDLHRAKFPAGSAARSLLARVPVLVRRPRDDEAFELLVDRSFAAYAEDWLLDAARGMASEAGTA